MAFLAKLFHEKHEIQDYECSRLSAFCLGCSSVDFLQFRRVEITSKKNSIQVKFVRFSTIWNSRVSPETETGHSIIF